MKNYSSGHFHFKSTMRHAWKMKQSIIFTAARGRIMQLDEEHTDLILI